MPHKEDLEEGIVEVMETGEAQEFVGCEGKGLLLLRWGNALV